MEAISQSGLPVDGRYELLVSAINGIAIFMLDAQGIVTSWNPGARRLKGYAASEVIGKHFSLFYSQEERAAGVPDAVLDRAARDGHVETEGWRVRQDGTQFWAHVVLEPIRAADGRVIGFGKITRDLSVRREIAEKLRRSEEQFRLLVHGVTDHAIYMLDREGHIVSWNAGAERITGYRRDEIIGRHFSIFYRQRDRDVDLPGESLRTALHTGHWEHEGQRVRKDGTRFWAEVTIDAIRDESSAIVGFAKVTHDVSERRAAQRALEDARETMFQSQRVYALGQLTSGIAHDFNNLLAIVTGVLETLRDDVHGQQGEQIDMAMNAAERGAALIKQLLAFARGEEVKLQPVDVAATVRSLAGMLRRAVGPTIRLDTRIASAPPVLIDPSQLNTALLNLVINARDAMPEGGTLTVTVSPAPGGMVALDIEDTGAGMDAATLEKATQPFFTTKQAGKGTGLGLAMVQGMVERSGGSMTIRSEVGQGTTISILLPVQPAT